MSGRAATRADRRFVVALGDWPRRVGTRLESHLAAPAGALGDELATSTAGIDPGTEIVLDAVIEVVSGGVVVNGRVRTRWHGECRRCLAETTGALEASFVELCVEEPDDDSVYRVGAFELDLEPIVHDACILELPLAPLCSPDCRGLCPVCGVDRNREHCECGPAPDGRWAALTGLYENEDKARATSEGVTGN